MFDDKNNNIDTTMHSEILELLPGYNFYKNALGQYVWCSQDFLQLAAAQSLKDIQGKTDLDLKWSSQISDQMTVDDQRVLRKGISLSKEYKIQPTDNCSETIYIRIERTPVYDKNKNVCGIAAIGQNVSQQKNEEKELLTKLNFIKDIFYNLPGLIYWKNLKSQYMGFNKNVVQLSGLTKDELLGKTDLELNWGKREAESFQRDDQEVIKTGIAKITEHQIPILRDDGNLMVVKTIKSRLFDDSGNVAGVLAVAVDITEQKILENNLLTEKKKVEVLSQAKTEFIRNMEHDIRTPFTGIYSLSKVLESLESNEEKKHMIVAISQSAKELLDYCNIILDFSRIESGSTPILEKRFDLKELIKKIVILERPVIESKNLAVTIDYPDKLNHHFIGDEYRIERILVNLISNAVKFTENGEIGLKVIIMNIKNDRQALIKLQVIDTGIGIPNDKLDMIFEKFNRLSPSNNNKYKGVGLGLSIVKHLLHELDGEIDVVSSSQGTTFTCTIPLKIPLEEMNERSE